MGWTNSIRALLTGAVFVAAAAAIAGWIDALRLGWGEDPPLEWTETASLAARGSLLLAAPLLGTLILVGIVSASRAVMRARRAEGAGSESRAASDDPVLLAGIVIVGWSSGLLVLALSGYSVKIGWLLGALLVGVLSGWACPRALRRFVVEGSARPGRFPRAAAAATGASVILWGAIWILPAAGDGSAAAPGAVGASSAAGRPGILLIVIDALRADHLGVYGYTRPTSPSIDRLAGRSVRFDDAAAPASWTLPSMASIMTSSYPGQHGVVDKGDIMPPGIEALAGKVARSGYTAVGFTTNPWLKKAFRFGDGFAAYYDLDRLGLSRSLVGVRLKNLALRRLGLIRVEPELVPRAEEVTERGLRWLRRRGGEPFFLYLHYMDVHAPYDPIAPYKGTFCKGHRLDRRDPFLESRFRAGKYKGNAAVLAHVIELYDEEILAADAAIGRLLDGLERMGLRDRTAVILTADHGEEFYEHGDTTHGNNLYQTTVRVPLIIDPPGPDSPARVVGDRVSLLDIYPTILDLAGAAAPKAIEGVSLRPYLAREKGRVPARTIGSQIFIEGRPWTAFFVGQDKLIRVRPPVSDPSAASRIELYRLDRDPGETTNVASSNADLATSLASALDAYDKVWGIPGLGGKRPGESIDPETLKQLKALGYVN